MSLLMKIERFLAREGMAQTKFGRLVVNDPRLVGDMRRGRQPGPRTAGRIEEFIRRAAADASK